MTISTARLARTLGALMLACLALPLQAVAAQKVWVSRTGVDTGTCGAVASPCASFQQAHDNVAAGGEIGVLTPGDYGAISINKPVAVTNDGTGTAGIQQLVGIAIFVAAGPGDVVGLRGLVIDGVGTGGFGVSFLAGSALHVQNCVIRNFEGQSTSIGLLFSSNSAHGQLFVSDSLVYNNGSGATSGGIFVQPGSTNGAIKAALSRVRLENNVIGLRATSVVVGGSVRATIRDSTVVGNVADGILANYATGQAVRVSVDRTAVVNNAGAGVHANGAHAIILLGDSSLTNNGTGISATGGGQVISYGDNADNLNVGAEGAPTSLFTPF